jgi:regulator of RNase E activity RraA
LQPLFKSFSELSTPLIADACLRLKLPYRVAPPGIRPLSLGYKIAGRAIPTRHYGSVDIFLEAMMGSEAGDVLVIDNGGRTDEGCVGDLTVLEAKASGLAGMLVWGCHRDSDELARIDFPVFSYGACPSGPQRLDARERDALELARFGYFSVSKQDAVFADSDGVVFVLVSDVESVLPVALAILQTERKQADAIRDGKKLRDQLQLETYLKRRTADPSYTFRKHLRSIGGAVEE